MDPLTVGMLVVLLVLVGGVVFGLVYLVRTKASKTNKLEDELVATFRNDGDRG